MRIPIPKLFRRKEKPQLSREEALNARPIRNPVVEWRVNEEGEVQLTVPLHYTRWMRLIKILFRAPDKREIALDEVGSEVWHRCDGEHTVQDLIDFLTARHKLNRKEAEVSLTHYLRTLAQRGLVGLALESEPARPSQPSGQGGDQ
ncbi:MAG TPA: PqqD family protein [Armatimonadetes bacterium]|nr:PqqD family protein [Armatimonadota bacterium]